MFFGTDPLYLLLMLPALALAGWAGPSTRRIVKAARYRASSGVSGAQAAAAVMGSGRGPQCGGSSRSEVSSRSIRRKRCSDSRRSNYQDHSLAALGVAAHEAGHALQDAQHYPLLVVRNLIVPLAGLGSKRLVCS